MSVFWEHLFRFSFLQYALVAGILASIACGVVGSFVVVRRSTYVAGAIAHCVLGGMGAARYMNSVHGVQWMSPFIGATAAALIAGVIIAVVSLSERHRTDTVISAVWAIGMAVGISFITATPGYHEDLMSYLFGNILMVGKSDIIHMAVLDVIIIGVVFVYFEKFLIISFQPELARLRGLNVAAYQILLLMLISLTIVLLTRIVGLVMVIALLTLPAATASLITGRLWTMMVLAASFCLIFTVGGIAISYGPELPAGATVIEITGAGYLLVFGIERFFTYRKKKKIYTNSCIEDNSNAHK